MLNDWLNRGVTSLFVEGGAEVNGSFVMAKAINQIITYIAPKLFGGTSAPTAIGGAGFTEVADALQLDIIESVTKWERC